MKSFSTKIITSIILIITICTGLFMGFSYLMIQRTVQNQMRNDGTTLINTLKREVLNYDMNDFDIVYTLFDKMKKESDGNIVYISLSDNQDNILVSDKGIQNSTNISDDVSGASQKNEKSVKVDDETTGIMLNQGNYEVYNISTSIPYGNNISGKLNIGLSLESVSREIKASLIYIFIMGLIVILVTSLVGIIISKKLTKSLNIILSNMDVVAKGDFTADFKVNEQDQFSSINGALNKFLQEIRGTVSKIKNTIINLNQISNDLSSHSEKVEKSSESTSAKIVEVSEMISTQRDAYSDMTMKFDEFNSNMESMAHKAQEVSKRNYNINNASDIGRGKLDQLIVTITDVQTSFKTASEDIKSLNENVDKIYEITEVINDVAQQTNLLALNAAIEASRAGDVGKGFAVVADEIKILAEKVIDSSKNINKLIETIMNTTKLVTKGNTVITNKINTQELYVKSTVDSFENIGLEVINAINQIDVLKELLENISNQKQSILSNIKYTASISENIMEYQKTIGESAIDQRKSVKKLIEIASDITNLSEGLNKDIKQFKIQ